MRRVSVCSEANGGGDRIWLDQLGVIEGLTYETTYPGGDSQASWQITLDARAQHRAWLYGRSISLWLGADAIWRGKMDQPSRGTTWTMNADGNAAEAMNYRAIATTSGNALELDEVVDAAIVRGLPFVRSGSLPTLPDGSQPSGSLNIAEALDQVASGQTTETYWQTDTNGLLTMAAAPTEATRILYATAPGGGRSLTGFATDVFVDYFSASGVQSIAARSVASRRFGRFEAYSDQSTLGLIPSTQADDMGDGFLARNAARMKFTSDFTVTSGQLVTLGGQPVDLATVRAGFLAQVVFTDPDSAGEVALEQSPRVLFGGARYDVDSDTLTLTPVYAAQDNLVAMLGSGSLVA